MKKFLWKNITWFMAAAIIAAVLAITGYITGAWAFDKKVEHDKFTLSGDPSQTYVRVRVFGTAVAPYIDYHAEGIVWHEKVVYYKQQASGVVLAPDFILTAAHIVTIDSVDVPDSPVSCFRTRPRKVLSMTILCYDYKGASVVAEVYYIDRDRDIALLKCGKNSFFRSLKAKIPNGYKFERLDIAMVKTLDPGDIVVIPVHKRDEFGRMTYDIELKWGKVISRDPVTINPRFLTELNFCDFTMNVPIIPGDSGSPVIAFLDGTPYLIGIVTARNRENPKVVMSYATWIQGLDRYLKMKP